MLYGPRRLCPAPPLRRCRCAGRRRLARGSSLELTPPALARFAGGASFLPALAGASSIAAGGGEKRLGLLPTGALRWICMKRRARPSNVSADTTRNDGPSESTRRRRGDLLRKFPAGDPQNREIPANAVPLRPPRPRSGRTHLRVTAARVGAVGPGGEPWRCVPRDRGVIRTAVRARARGAPAVRRRRRRRTWRPSRPKPSRPG